MIADHAAVAPGESSVVDDHYGGARAKPRRAIRPKTLAENAFCGLGASAEAFLTGAAAAGHTRLGPELAELNTLAAAHGFGAEPYFDQPFYVGYNVAGYELGLLPDGSPRDGALTYWGVDDVAVAVRAAIEAGSTEHTPPSEVGEGIITATVRTPQHTVLGFIYNPHFKTA